MRAASRMHLSDIPVRARCVAQRGVDGERPWAVPVRAGRKRTV